jgi:hypothetical protein
MSMTDLAAAGHSPDLDELVARIRDAHQAVQQQASGMLRAAMAAGEALITAKAQVPDGKWSAWLRHFCNFSRRTAYVYMQLAAHRAEIEQVVQHAAHPSLREALRLIAPSRSCRHKDGTANTTVPVLDPAAWAAAGPAERGEFLAHIGLPAILAAMPDTWRAEIARRVEGQRRQAASPLAETLTRALRHALSLQASAEGDALGNSVAAALNALANKLSANGLDLHDLDVVIRAPTTKRRAA